MISSLLNFTINAQGLSGIVIDGYQEIGTLLKLLVAINRTDTKMSNNNDGFDPLSILERVCLVYGFTQKIQLANHFKMSASSLSNRYTRGNVSYDLVVHCSLETGANVKWLMTGEGERNSDQNTLDKEHNEAIKLERFTISEGEMPLAGYFYLDAQVLANRTTDVFILQEDDTYTIVERTSALTDGWKILDIDGYISAREVLVLPGRKLRIYGGKEPFECSVDDVKILGHLTIVINELSS